MHNTELKKDWLAGNGAVAFLSALMLAQTWRTVGGTCELPFNLTIPVLPAPFSFTIAGFLFLILCPGFGLDNDDEAYAALGDPRRTKSISGLGFVCLAGIPSELAQ